MAGVVAPERNKVIVDSFDWMSLRTLLIDAHEVVLNEHIIAPGGCALLGGCQVPGHGLGKRRLTLGDGRRIREGAVRRREYTRKFVHPGYLVSVDQKGNERFPIHIIGAKVDSGQTPPSGRKVLCINPHVCVCVCVCVWGVCLKARTTFVASCGIMTPFLIPGPNSVTKVAGC